MLLLFALVARAGDPSVTDRVEAATRVLQQVRAQETSGAATPEDVYRWSVRVMEAERDAGVPDAAASHAARMRELATTVMAQVAAGALPQVAIDEVRFYQAEAEKPPDRGPIGRPLPLPAPALVAAPAPAALPSLEPCFQACDGQARTCAQSAEHFRLGVGDVSSPDPDCAKQADAKCGTGRSQTATECRDGELRSCTAAKMSADCALARTQCAARCR